ncbi:MAG TPA: hypothetical protein VFW11_01305 [Cyclobacteriaceae bacterium]|nr:hypothetical protein [Cyclobacteriaceae bacterium]
MEWLSSITLRSTDLATEFLNDDINDFTLISVAEFDLLQNGDSFDLEYINIDPAIISDYLIPSDIDDFILYGTADLEPTRCMRSLNFGCESRVIFRCKEFVLDDTAEFGVSPNLGLTDSGYFGEYVSIGDDLAGEDILDYPITIFLDVAPQESFEGVISNDFLGHLGFDGFEPYYIGKQNGNVISMNVSFNITGNLNLVDSSNNQMLTVIEEIRDHVISIKEKFNDKETLVSEANKIIELKPNIAGMGINVNALIDKYLKRKDRS